MASPLFLVAALAVLGLAIWLRPWPLFLESEPNSRPEERTVAHEFRKWVELQARVRGLNVRGVARPVPLECPRCRKNSNYFVYPDELCEKCWRAELKAAASSSKHATGNRSQPGLR